MTFRFSLAVCVFLGGWVRIWWRLGFWVGVASWDRVLLWLGVICLSTFARLFAGVGWFCGFGWFCDFCALGVVFGVYVGLAVQLPVAFVDWFWICRLW